MGADLFCLSIGKILGEIDDGDDARSLSFCLEMCFTPARVFILHEKSASVATFSATKFKMVDVLLLLF